VFKVKASSCKQDTHNWSYVGSVVGGGGEGKAVEMGRLTNRRRGGTKFTRPPTDSHEIALRRGLCLREKPP